MSFSASHKHMLSLIFCVSLPLAAVLAASIAFDWPNLDHPLGQWLNDTGLPLFLPWMILAIAAALAGAIWGGQLWQNGQEVAENAILDACRNLALGEELTDLRNFDGNNALDRVGLAIQILRDSVAEHQSHYQHFFQTASDMFISIAPASRRILDVNPALLEIMGLERGELIGRKIEGIITLEEGWDTAMRNPDKLLGGHINTPQGMVNIEVSVSVQFTQQGHPWFFGAIMRDVTEREKMAVELIKKTRALESALEEIRSVEKIKDEFLTTLSHELKTPLVSLKGFMQLLMRGSDMSEQSTAHLNVCWRNLVKLENQINNLLDLARLSRYKDQYQLAPLDLGLLLQTECENLKPAAEERNVGLRLEPSPPVETKVMGHTEKMAQLMDNLILNAVKYNKDGGEVVLSLSRDNGKAVLEVKDSGVGIAREHMANIFNRFYQAELSGTGRLEGLGIGLSLVQEIVKLHNGDISVDSEVGKGTKFTVTLEALS